MKEIPKAEISWYMGRVHVSVPDAEIVADFRKRCKRVNASAELTEAIVAYALECHHRNQKLYAFVINGGK